MMKLVRTAGTAVYRYPFIPAVILSLILVLVQVHVCAEETPQNAHQFMRGPAGATAADYKQHTSTGFDRETLVYATYLTLKTDHSRQTHEDIRTTALMVIDAADARGIDPFVALAVIIQETRFTSVGGDGGNACGIGQQHAKFSISWKTSTARSVREECKSLMNPQFAATVLAEHLSIIKKRSPNLRNSVYQYNGDWDKRGEGWWHGHFKWRCLIEQYYDLEVRRRGLLAARAADLKGSYKWWRVRLASRATPKIR